MKGRTATAAKPTCRWCKSPATQEFMGYNRHKAFWSCDNEDCLAKSEWHERRIIEDGDALR